MKKIFCLAILLCLSSACNSQKPSSTPAAKPQPKAPDLSTGRVAFQKLYVAAHGWAGDAQPFRVESEVSDASKGAEGKATLWRAWFASASKRGVKPYVWTGVDTADAERGITPGSEDNYNPSNSSTQVFELQYLKVDSDQAYDVAQKHGGEKLLAKSPDIPVSYALDWSRASNELIWHVFYGSSSSEAKLTVEVNASSGEFIRVEK